MSPQGSFEKEEGAGNKAAIQQCRPQQHPGGSSSPLQSIRARPLWSGSAQAALPRVELWGGPGLGSEGSGRSRAELDLGGVHGPEPFL